MTAQPLPSAASAWAWDESTTLGDSPQPPDAIPTGGSPANAAASPGDTDATLADSSQADNGIAASVSEQTINTPGHAAAPFQETMAFCTRAPDRWPLPGCDLSARDGSLLPHRPACRGFALR